MKRLYVSGSVVGDGCRSGARYGACAKVVYDLRMELTSTQINARMWCQKRGVKES